MVEIDRGLRESVAGTGEVKDSLAEITGAAEGMLIEVTMMVA